jgi:hypothetical protein
LGGENDLKIEIKSQIMKIGTTVVFKLLLVSIVLTKGINMVGAREAFGIMKDLTEIDRKVKELFNFQMLLKYRTFADENFKDQGKSKKAIRRNDVDMFVKFCIVCFSHNCKPGFLYIYKRFRDLQY